MTSKAISPLRARMIDDMMMRRFGEKTQSDYIRRVKNFTIFLGRAPDTAEPEDLRRYQVHQSRSGVQPPTMNSTVATLRFFFTTTCNRPEMARHLTLVGLQLQIRSLGSELITAELPVAEPGAEEEAHRPAGALLETWFARLRVAARCI